MAQKDDINLRNMKIKFIFPTKKRINSIEEKESFKSKAFKKLEEFECSKDGDKPNIDLSFLNEIRVVSEDILERDIKKMLSEQVMSTSILFMIKNNHESIKNLISESIFERLDISIRIVKYFSDKEETVDMFIRNFTKGRKKFSLSKENTIESSTKERFFFLLLVVYLLYIASQENI